MGKNKVKEQVNNMELFEVPTDDMYDYIAENYPGFGPVIMFSNFYDKSERVEVYTCDSAIDDSYCDVADVSYNVYLQFDSELFPDLKRGTKLEMYLNGEDLATINLDDLDYIEDVVF